MLETVRSILKHNHKVLTPLRNGDKVDMLVRNPKKNRESPFWLPGCHVVGFDGRGIYYVRTPCGHIFQATRRRQLRKTINKFEPGAEYEDSDSTGRLQNNMDEGNIKSVEPILMDEEDRPGDDGDRPFDKDKEAAEFESEKGILEDQVHIDEKIPDRIEETPARRIEPKYRVHQMMRNGLDRIAEDQVNNIQREHIPVSDEKSEDPGSSKKRNVDMGEIPCVQLTGSTQQEIPEVLYAVQSQEYLREERVINAMDTLERMKVEEELSFEDGQNQENRGNSPKAKYEERPKAKAKVSPKIKADPKSSGKVDPVPKVMPISPKPSVDADSHKKSNIIGGKTSEESGSKDRGNTKAKTVIEKIAEDLQIEAIPIIRPRGPFEVVSKRVMAPKKNVAKPPPPKVLEGLRDEKVSRKRRKSSDENENKAKSKTDNVLKTRSSDGQKGRKAKTKTIGKWSENHTAKVNMFAPVQTRKQAADAKAETRCMIRERVSKEQSGKRRKILFIDDNGDEIEIETNEEDNLEDKEEVFTFWLKATKKMRLQTHQCTKLKTS